MNYADALMDDTNFSFWFRTPSLLLSSAESLVKLFRIKRSTQASRYTSYPLQYTTTMPQERVFSTSTQVYTSRWLAIQEYAKSHPRITGTSEKIGQLIPTSVLLHFRSQVIDILGKDQDFKSEPIPVQEWNIDQEVIRKFCQ